MHQKFIFQEHKERDSKNFMHPPYFLARFTLQLHFFCSAIPVYFVSQPTIWAMLECQDLFSCFRSFHVIFQKDIHYVQKVLHPYLNNHRHCCFQKMVLLHPATKQNRNFGINIFGIRVWWFFSFQKCGTQERIASDVHDPSWSEVGFFCSCEEFCG